MQGEVRGILGVSAMHGGALCSGDGGGVVSGDGEPSVQEVGGVGGGPDHLAGKPPLAGIVKGNDQRVLDALGEAFEPIPWEGLKASGDFLWPDDLEVKFLGKDLTPRLSKRWGTMRMGEEGGTIRERLQRAVGVYDWVLKRRPEGVLVWTDEYPETRAAVMAGNDLGIPTIELVHGGFRAFQHGDPHASGWAKWKLGSWQYRDWHVANRLPGRVIVTGISHMDPWSRTNLSLARSVARKSLRISEAAPVVLFLEDAPFERTPWGMVDFGREIQHEVLKAYKTAEGILEGLQLIVNLHPADRDSTPQGYQEILKRYGITSNYTILDENLPLCIAAADVAIGAKASSIIEGLHVGLPGVVCEFRPFFDPKPWTGRGMVVVTDPREVASKLVHVLTDSNLMSQLIRDTPKGARYFGTDGLGAQRAELAIRAILAGKEPGESCWMSPPD